MFRYYAYVRGAAAADRGPTLFRMKVCRRGANFETRYRLSVVIRKTTVFWKGSTINFFLFFHFTIGNIYTKGNINNCTRRIPRRVAPSCFYHLVESWTWAPKPISIRRPNDLLRALKNRREQKKKLIRTDDIRTTVGMMGSVPSRRIMEMLITVARVYYDVYV